MCEDLKGQWVQGRLHSLASSPFWVGPEGIPAQGGAELGGTAGLLPLIPTSALAE